MSAEHSINPFPLGENSVIVNLDGSAAHHIPLSEDRTEVWADQVDLLGGSLVVGAAGVEWEDKPYIKTPRRVVAEGQPADTLLTEEEFLAFQEPIKPTNTLWENLRVGTARMREPLIANDDQGDRLSLHAVSGYLRALFVDKTAVVPKGVAGRSLEFLAQLESQLTQEVMPPFEHIFEQNHEDPQRPFVSPKDVLRFAAECGVDLPVRVVHDRLYPVLPYSCTYRTGPIDYFDAEHGAHVIAFGAKKNGGRDVTSAGITVDILVKMVRGCDYPQATKSAQGAALTYVLLRYVKSLEQHVDPALLESPAPIPADVSRPEMAPAHIEYGPDDQKVDAYYDVVGTDMYVRARKDAARGQYSQLTSLFYRDEDYGRHTGRYLLSKSRTSKLLSDVFVGTKRKPRTSEVDEWLPELIIHEDNFLREEQRQYGVRYGATPVYETGLKDPVFDRQSYYNYIIQRSNPRKIDAGVVERIATTLSSEAGSFYIPEPGVRRFATGLGFEVSETRGRRVVKAHYITLKRLREALDGDFGDAVAPVDHYFLRSFLRANGA